MNCSKPFAIKQALYGGSITDPPAMNLIRNGDFANAGQYWLSGAPGDYSGGKLTLAVNQNASQQISGLTAGEIYLLKLDIVEVADEFGDPLIIYLGCDIDGQRSQTGNCVQSLPTVSGYVGVEIQCDTPNERQPIQVG